jgi:hypothetical protein
VDKGERSDAEETGFVGKRRRFYIEGREDKRERRPEERNEKVVEKKEKIANKEKNEQETLQRTETLLKGTTNKKQVKRKMNSSEDCYAGNCLDIICSG